ncbi:hypothetical protein [Terrimonas pollutisoli]|uniref:hypothetical protein n=1 Tax=Terrimonas pollutisoli TaxID=3034147 RepID=UPI0023EA8E2B|nr:hypothetical protein [Terrimonas sp. H1YJ31]
MKYSLIIAAIFISLQTFSQDCTKELLKQKPGTWKAGPKGSIANVSAADLAKEKAAVGAIHKMVSANFKPTGCQISYSTVYGKYLNAGQNWVADPYHYSMYVLRYICDQQSTDKSKYYVDVSTPTTVTITANVIFSLNNLYAATIPADDSRGYLKLKQRPERKEGYYFMGEEVVGDSHLENKIKEYRWLITYNDTLPFLYVSRKEYLLIQKKRLEQTIKDEGAHDFNNKCMSNINEELKKPEAELIKPAICPWNDEQRFTGFVEEGTRGSFIAVKPNPAYYRKKLPKSSPQFFSVVYKIAHGDPVFEENIAAIKKAVDFAALKNMLGK